VTGFDPVIPPGGEGKVTASLATNRYSGTIAKTISVYSNDPKNPRAVLRLQGTVLVPIEVRPAERVHFSGRAGIIPPQQLFLISREGEPFDILEMGKRSPHLTVALVPAPEKARPLPGGEKAPVREPAEGAVVGGHAAYMATLSLDEETPVGRLSDLVTLTTNHPKLKRLDIRVGGVIDGEVMIRPQSLYFQRPRPGRPAHRREVRLSRRPEGGLKILSVESTDPEFLPELLAVTEGFEYRVRVQRKEGATGIKKATMRIETNHGLLEVPITAY
jgi:hypothetical protein